MGQQESPLRSRPLPCKNSFVIKYVDVSKNYGLTEVLHHINLAIEPGECVAITGESGAGKSTLLHMLIGAEKPTAGSIQIDNFKIETLSPANLQLFRRSVGVVFQDFKLLQQKTVFENVAFALEACDEDDTEIFRKAHEAIAKVGMKGKEHRFPRQLSGGEQQRTAIARAIVHNPRVVIADEPTGNLDWKNSIEIVNILKKINSEGVTVIVATHNNEILELLKPRIIKIEHGKAHEQKLAATHGTQKIDLSGM